MTQEETRARVSPNLLMRSQHCSVEPPEGTDSGRLPVAGGFSVFFWKNPLMFSEEPTSALKTYWTLDSLSSSSSQLQVIAAFLRIFEMERNRKCRGCSGITESRWVEEQG